MTLGTYTNIYIGPGDDARYIQIYIGPGDDARYIYKYIYRAWG